MTSYLLCYDLRKGERSEDYKTMINELKMIDARKIQYSMWLNSVDNAARKILDHFEEILDGNDRLWISEVSKNDAYRNAMKGTNYWLKINPPAR